MLRFDRKQQNSVKQLSFNKKKKKKKTELIKKNCKNVTLKLTWPQTFCGDGVEVGDGMMYVRGLNPQLPW